MRLDCVILVFIGLLMGLLIGQSVAEAQPRAVGCYAKGGWVVAGVCIDRRVIIR